MPLRKRAAFIADAAALSADPPTPVARAGFVLPSGTPIMSLPSAEIATAFGLNPISDRVSRAEAMSVPTMRRARSIICGTIATLPLIAIRAPGTADAERLTRPLLDQPDPNTTAAWVKAWTVDDLLFHGIAWWKVTERDGQGYPLNAVRKSTDRVMVDVSAGRVFVDGKEVDHRDLIRFDGLDDGILAAARPLKLAILLDRAVERNSSGMPPQDYLRLAEGAAELSNEPGSAGDDTDRSQIDALLDEWEAARADRSTAFINRAVEHGLVGFDPRAGQLAEARAYQAAEIARLCNLDTDAVDAPGSNAMTYANTESKRRELRDTTLAPFMSAIDQRLSMGDVTPRGTVVRFDPWAWLRADTAALITAGAAAVDAGLLDVDEIRVDWLDRPPKGAPAPDPES